MEQKTPLTAAAASGCGRGGRRDPPPRPPPQLPPPPAARTPRARARRASPAPTSFPNCPALPAAPGRRLPTCARAIPPEVLLPPLRPPGCSGGPACARTSSRGLRALCLRRPIRSDEGRRAREFRGAGRGVSGCGARAARSRRSVTTVARNSEPSLEGRWDGRRFPRLFTLGSQPSSLTCLPRGSGGLGLPAALDLGTPRPHRRGRGRRERVLICDYCCKSSLPSS